MKVYVVMGNDYPDAVFDSEQAAKSFCEAKKAKNATGERPIYWRYFEFEMNRESA